MQLQNLTNEERYRIIIENTRDFAIATIDLEGLVVDWNIGAERVLGYTAQEILGRSASIIFTPEDCAKKVPEQELNKARVEGKALDERWHVRKDGSRFWGSGYVEAIKDPSSGHCMGFVKIFRDMTDHKMLSEALKKSNEDLKQFAAMASHDLQAPLYQITVLAQLIEMKSPEEAKTYIKDISAAAEKMRLLIHDLIELHKADEGMPQNQETVDLNQVLKRALDNLKPIIAQKNPTIEAHPLPQVKANASHMLQVFQNLLDNAIKYSGNDGKPAVIKVASVKENGFVKIRVSDNGIGFEEQYIEEIFKPFKRYHSEEYDGTGLGLAICKKIVEKYGGEITAESKVGNGSAFTIKFPA